MRNFLVLALLSSVSYAQNSLPPSCTTLPIEGETWELKTDKPIVVLMQNISESTLWITHPLQDMGASAGFTSQIHSQKWSALVITKGPFAIHCVESKPGHEQQIPCAQSLKACVWSGITMPENVQGVFWVGENRSLKEIKAEIKNRGFK